MEGSVSISGLGIICAIGNEAADVVSALKAGRSGIGSISHLATRHTGIPVGEVSLSNERMMEMLGVSGDSPVSRTALMGAIAIRQALQDAGIGEIPSGKRVVLISGTTAGDMDAAENDYSGSSEGRSITDIPFCNQCGRSTAAMAEMAGLGGDVRLCTISTACSSALNSMILGCRLLLDDEADIVIAGGSEALTRFHLNGFNSLMILDSERCRPFDESHAGLNLGEGAAFVVMEKNASGGALACIRGYANHCDAFHQTASSENGEGAFLAMRDALRMSGLNPGDIQYVNAHGTGTPNNDASESAALRRIFTSGMPPVSSTKAFTGHTTSASGSIEAAICILAMREGFIPANLGWKSAPEGGIIPTSGREEACLDNIMCNSFGFGGNDSCIIIGRAAAPVHPSAGNPAERRSVRTLADIRIGPETDLSALKEFVPAMQARRMDRLMKASILSACLALKEAGIRSPGAIIGATSRGMLEESQKFLAAILENGESSLSPTVFMQSTHNTIASAIAIHSSCHGYNITYSQNEDSEKWAVWDAEDLVARCGADTVLVCSFDESTPEYDILMRKQGLPVPEPLSVHTMIFAAEND